jgi:hypothetical protein
MFLHARVARLAKEPHERAVGIVGAGLSVVCANQLFGDMGLVSSVAMYLLAAGYGIAMRYPITTNVWPVPVVAPRPEPAGPATASVASAAEESAAWPS